MVPQYNPSTYSLLVDGVAVAKWRNLDDIGATASARYLLAQLGHDSGELRVSLDGYEEVVSLVGVGC